jgi:hypothetical protein
MGSYFAKPAKNQNIPFEALERSVDVLNPSQYPTFERSTEWAKTKHIYSEQICFQERYVSWGIIIVLFLILLSFIYLNHTDNKSFREIELEN